MNAHCSSDYNAANLLKVGFPSVELFLGKREGHVAPVFNRLLGDNRETEQEKRLKLWLRQIL